MHDKLFANQQDAGSPEPREVRPGARPGHGQVQGGAGRGEAARSASSATCADAAKFGARGTPTFFINGRNCPGAQPFEAFKSVIDEEHQEGRRELIAGGTPRGQLYAALTEDGLDKAAAPPPQPPREQPDAGTRSTRPTSRRRAGARAPRTRQGHHRRVLRLPVPVLQPRRADARPGDGGRTRARCASSWRTSRCRSTTTRCPPPRRRCAAQRAGQVLGDARQAVRQPAGRSTAPTSRSTPQELGLNMGKFKAALDAEQGQGRRSRPTPPRAARSARAARRVLHQRRSSCRARSRSRRSRR